ncbi:DUF3021 domain-containing protein [Paenibacillus sp. MER TA 81-3]|uniref:DUF3021 domain-containing protein n=1 Tax=Paenibacillus sp. MER TA 81-3 TaxID=2939573 RepID=UPI00203B74EF|nr:DUF3021 domain-containing protein [Paenibacillus sp. MER TA 81-3]MCM3342109.1 DUF3021 domain-containing protein [Paenibacillus sp. MER TA 81-3]
MLKKLLSRAAGGFAYGVLVGQVVQIIISLSLGEGKFMPVISDFRSLFENETTAVIAQMILTGIIGVAFATSSVVFDIPKWSLLKQYVVHFCITAIVWVPIVIICWMPKTYKSIIILGVNFLGTYLITWFIQYTISKKDIQEINAAIKAEK